MVRTTLFLFFFYAWASVFGQANPDSVIVDSLLLTARNLAKQGDFEEALATNATAEKTALDRFGRGSERYGKCCLNRGMIANRREDFPEAEKWYREAVDILAVTPGKVHPDYAFSLSELATMYSVKREFDKARPLFLEAKEVFEVRLNDRTHRNYLICLNNLATMYSKTGENDQAEQLYLEMKEIFEVRLNNRAHPNYLSCLNNLAHLYSNLGDFEKAESFFREALIAREKTLGKDHPAYIESLGGLGVVYARLGNYAMAESLFLEVKAAKAKALGTKHRQYAGSLESLATLYSVTGKYDQSEQLYLEAISILKKTVGEEHPDYIRTRENLANLYVKKGSYAQGEPLLLEGLAWHEKTAGKNSPDYAIVLSDLAYLYVQKGDQGKAEKLYREAKEIYEVRLNDRKHPFYQNSLGNLANLYKNTGRFEKAGPLFDELAGQVRSRYSQATRHLSERELSVYLLKFAEIQDQVLSFAQVSGGKRSAAACYDNALFYKGFLLGAASRVRRLARVNPASEAIFERLKTCEARLAAEYARPPAERREATALEAEAALLEKDLVRTVAGYDEATRQVNWQDVQRALKPGEAAVEFVRYGFWDQALTDSVLYAALVVLPAGQPVFVPLFEEKALGSLLSAVKTRKSDYVDHVYKPGHSGGNTAGSLYAMIWQPLDRNLTGIRTVYVSPAGLLHRLNLGAIPLPAAAETLADRYRVVTLGSTRSLLPGNPASAPELSASAALLMGAVRYDSDSTVLAASPDLQNAPMASRRNLGFADTDSTGRGGQWDFLPWTEKEVNAIAATLSASGIQPVVRNGFAATEAFFKSMGRLRQGAGEAAGSPGIPSPRILHIATHGYFFPDPKDDTRRTDAAGQEPVFKTSDHPMIRSGLLLAGANYAWKTGRPVKPGMEDGVLTAYEISQMDLSNTELVVLSACETGLGDIQGNEGVYGLQRAFKIAGAKYLIMSLWQVPDFQTQELMTFFYQKWLTDKMAIPDAFQAAQQQMRKKYEHPYFWAGFVLIQ